MATTPDSHPDSPPEGADEHPDDFEPGTIDPGHHHASAKAPDSPGTEGGTAGTMDNKVQDELDR
jgi:hypothetical protein